MPVVKLSKYSNIDWNNLLLYIVPAVIVILIAGKNVIPYLFMRSYKAISIDDRNNQIILASDFLSNVILRFDDIKAIRMEQNFQFYKVRILTKNSQVYAINVKRAYDLLDNIPDSIQKGQSNTSAIFGSMESSLSHSKQQLYMLVFALTIIFIVGCAAILGCALGGVQGAITLAVIVLVGTLIFVGVGSLILNFVFNMFKR